MRRRIVLLIVGLLAATATATAMPTNAAPASATDPANSLMASINEARAANGLVPLRPDPRLWTIAGDRAARLGRIGILSHEAAGSLPLDLANGIVRWFAYGEVIGYASGTPGEASRSIFQMWRASDHHWPLLMDERFNYLGVGLYQASSGLVYISVVTTESPDRTGPQAGVVEALVSGADIRWSWQGRDPPLQTHTAGLGDFTVQLQQDRGPWATVGTALTTTAWSTRNRAHGHWYGLRVRARDRAGNLGPWSRERRVWLP